MIQIVINRNYQKYLLDFQTFMSNYYETFSINFQITHENILNVSKVFYSFTTVPVQGLLFLPCLIDDMSVGGGGLLVVNPATGNMVLVNTLETTSFSGSRKNRCVLFLVYEVMYIKL